ncbi:DUF455 domain-containing protein, partial [Sinorhizobium meliloti]
MSRYGKTMTRLPQFHSLRGAAVEAIRAADLA